MYTSMTKIPFWDLEAISTLSIDINNAKIMDRNAISYNIYRKGSYMKYVRNSNTAHTSARAMQDYRLHAYVFHLRPLRGDTLMTSALRGGGGLSNV